MPNFIEIEDTFCGRTDVRKFENHFVSWTQKSRPKNVKMVFASTMCTSATELWLIKSSLHHACYVKFFVYTGGRGYVFTDICSFVSLFVSKTTKKLLVDFQEIWGTGIS